MRRGKVIKFEKVSKVFGDYTALSEISFEVEKGKLVALIGPSGCGKTTSLRMINRLIEPTSGKIFINGDDIAQIDPVDLRRDIGYVIQQIGLLPHLTIGKNIGLVPYLKGWKEKDYSDKVDELMNMVGLPPKMYRNRYPSELSGGQQQRIGVIRALAAEPPIVLMDEPFSALDPISRVQLQDELVRLQKEIHKTIVFVTHDMDEALKIADYVAVMLDGHIIQLDTPENLVNHPVNDFVRDFLGEQRLYQQFEQKKTELVAFDVMDEQSNDVHFNDNVAKALSVIKELDTDCLLIKDVLGNASGFVTREGLLRNVTDQNLLIHNLIEKNIQFIDFNACWKEATRKIISSNLAGLIVLKDQKMIGAITQKSILKKLAKDEKVQV